MTFQKQECQQSGVCPFSASLGASQPCSWRDKRAVYPGHHFILWRLACLPCSVACESQRYFSWALTVGGMLNLRAHRPQYLWLPALWDALAL